MIIKDSLFALPLCLLIAGCGTAGSGNLEDLDVKVTAFDEIEVKDGIEAFISYDAEPGLRLRADDNLLDVLEVIQEGDKVIVQRKDDEKVRNETLQAYFVLPELSDLRLSGGGFATVTDVQASDELEIKLSGGSEMVFTLDEGDEVNLLLLESSGGSPIDIAGQFDRAEVQIEGGGEVTLSGKGSTLDLELSGGSKLDSKGFPVETSSVDLSGGSKAEISVSDAVSGELSGGSDLSVKGEATIRDVKTSGGSTVETE